MYRPVGDTRRNHAKAMLQRAGYEDGGEVVTAPDIGPETVPPEKPMPEIMPHSITKPRKLGRRARLRLRG